jgi:hypothetical protein
MKLTVANHSGRAIVDVILAIRPRTSGASPFNEAPSLSMLVMEAGATQPFAWSDHYSSNDDTWWRMEWTDADGVHWHRHDHSGADPIRSNGRFESAYTEREPNFTANKGPWCTRSQSAGRSGPGSPRHASY